MPTRSAVPALPLGCMGWRPSHARLAGVVAVGVTTACLDINPRFDEPTDAGEATGEVVAVGEWRHIACVDDGTEVSLFVDGTFVDSSVGQMGATNPLGDMYVGNHAIDLDQPFSGTVDNLRVFEDVRTPDEICQAAGTC